MSTRSEIRLFVDGKQKNCVYHHSDGYPSHIVNDINTLYGNSDNVNNLMENLSKSHGTPNPKCAYSKKHQGDIEYSYNVKYKKGTSTDYLSQPKLEIFKHPFNGKKTKVFSGDIHEAFKKYVCENDEK